MSDRAHETEGEEARKIRDRQVMEVLQELRVAITGGQILFGFLLTVPFAQRWPDTDDFQRTLFLITLLAIATATGCFIAPTAAHRVRFHQRDRSFLVSYANGAAIAGLVQPAGGDGLRGPARHRLRLLADDRGDRGGRRDRDRCCSRSGSPCRWPVTARS